MPKETEKKLRSEFVWDAQTERKKKKRKFGVLVQSKNSILGFRKTLDKTYS